jgi:uncharacterized damage-inducible protein DinB
MDTTLVHLYRHNRWANLRLLDVCAGLDPELLTAPSAGGTYGNVQDTLVHLLAAEERYTLLLTGEAAPPPPLRESDRFPGFELLRQRARWSGESLIAVASQDPCEQILRGTRGGEEYALPAFVPLVQAIHHGNEHRTQIASLLGRLGIEPPDLSAWAYGEPAGNGS